MIQNPTSLITFKVSNEKKQLLAKRALLLGTDVSSLLRDMIDNYLEVKNPSPEPWSELHRLAQDDPLAHQFTTIINSTRSKDNKSLPQF